jgi:hypothetical protein
MCEAYFLNTASANTEIAKVFSCMSQGRDTTDSK